MARHDERDQTNGYDHLSLKDLLDAHDLYHVHLMRHPNVVATAPEPLPHPQIRQPGRRTRRRQEKGTGERTLENSEVRPYSWPCVLAFVNEWIDETEFAAARQVRPRRDGPQDALLARRPPRAGLRHRRRAS